MFNHVIPIVGKAIWDVCIYIGRKEVCELWIDMREERECVGVRNAAVLMKAR